MVDKGHTFKNSLCGATFFSEWAGCVRHLYENSLQCHRQLTAPGSTVLLQSTDRWTLLVKFWPWGYFHLDFWLCSVSCPDRKMFRLALSLGVEPQAAYTLINNNYFSCQKKLTGTV